MCPRANPRFENTASTIDHAVSLVELVVLCMFSSLLHMKVATAAMVSERVNG